MQSPSQQSSTCPNCGGELDATPVSGIGSMTCLLRAGIGSEEETVHDSTPTSRAVHSRDPFARVQKFSMNFSSMPRYITTRKSKNFRQTKRKREAQ
jgi:hypothetical protein